MNINMLDNLPWVWNSLSFSLRLLSTYGLDLFIKFGLNDYCVIAVWLLCIFVSIVLQVAGLSKEKKDSLRRVHEHED